MSADHPLFAKLEAERLGLVLGIDQGFKKMAALLSCALKARERNNWDGGRALLNSALDLEYDLTGDCQVLGDLAEEWGVDLDRDVMGGIEETDPE